MRKTLAIALGFVVTLSVTACGNNEPAATPAAGSTQKPTAVAATNATPSDSAAPAVTDAIVDTVQPTDPAPTDPTSPETVADGTVGPVGDAPGAGSDFCNAIEALGLSAEDIGNTETLTPEDVKLRYEKFLADIASLAKVAPTEIAADVSLVQEGFDSFFGVLEKLDFDQAKVFTDPASSATLEESMGAEFDAAGNSIDAYSTAQCGFTVDG